MKTITKNVYTFDELSEEAQTYAWLNSDIDFSDSYSSEYRETLSAFEKIFDIRVYDYSVGGVYCPRFHFVTAGSASAAPEGDPLRLAKYVWNNFAADIMKGKFFCKGKYENGRYTYKHRHSKIMLEMDNCPLTGFFADCDILQPVIDCLHYNRTYCTFDTLIEDCLQAFFQAWQAEIDYCNSKKYFADAAAANEWYFYENGDFCKEA